MVPKVRSIPIPTTAGSRRPARLMPEDFFPSLFSSISHHFDCHARAARRRRLPRLSPSIWFNRQRRHLVLSLTEIILSVLSGVMVFRFCHRRRRRMADGFLIWFRWRRPLRAPLSVILHRLTGGVPRRQHIKAYVLHDSTSSEVSPYLMKLWTLLWICGSAQC
jgi:hypothetical protein